jgi:hypothetical protein
MAEPAQAVETVKVTITNMPTGIVVDREPFRVSKGKDKGRLQVEWICHSDGFTVEFTHESPFEQSKFSSPIRGTVLSGPVREDVKADGPDGLRKSYKYTVTIGKRIIDPTGQVDP